jgi:hypothetical protein
MGDTVEWTLSVPLPSAVNDFVEAFDSGDYLDLDAGAVL